MSPQNGEVVLKRLRPENTARIPVIPSGVMPSQTAIDHRFLPNQGSFSIRRVTVLHSTLMKFVRHGDKKSSCDVKSHLENRSGNGARTRHQSNGVIQQGDLKSLQNHCCDIFLRACKATGSNRVDLRMFFFASQDPSKTHNFTNTFTTMYNNPSKGALCFFLW